jgi:hypothetical protein
MKEYRRVPLSQLRRRLQIEEYEQAAPFQEVECRPAAVRIKMLQHTGQPAVPVVEGRRKGEAGTGGGARGRFVSWARTCTRASTAKCGR